MKNMILFSTILSPFLSAAHPGHGPVENGVSHYVLSPTHFIGIIAVVALFALLFVEVKRRNKKNA